MIKVYLLIIAYTLDDGSLRLVVKNAEDHCPTQAEAVIDMQPLKETGYMKDWTFWCHETYVMATPGRPS